MQNLVKPKVNYDTFWWNARTKNFNFIINKGQNIGIIYKKVIKL